MADDLARHDAARDEIEDFVFALAERMGLTASELCIVMIDATSTAIVCLASGRSSREKVAEAMAADLRGAILSSYAQLEQAAELSAMPAVGRA